MRRFMAVTALGVCLAGACGTASADGLHNYSPRRWALHEQHAEAGWYQENLAAVTIDFESGEVRMIDTAGDLYICELAGDSVVTIAAQ